MHRPLACLALLLCSTLAAAQDAAPAPSAGGGDPLKSPECGKALDELNAARRAAEAQDAPKDAAANAEAIRKRAVRTCLGLAEEAPQQRAARPAVPPLAIPAPRIEPSTRPPVFASPVLPAPPVAVDRPPTLTTCDAGGCWTNEGDRLQRLGPNLVGPRGVCTVQGAFVNCP